MNFYGFATLFIFLFDKKWRHKYKKHSFFVKIWWITCLCVSCNIQFVSISICKFEMWNVKSHNLECERSIIKVKVTGQRPRSKVKGQGKKIDFFGFSSVYSKNQKRAKCNFFCIQHICHSKKEVKKNCQKN